MNNFHRYRNRFFPLLMLMFSVILAQSLIQAQPMRRTPKERADTLKAQLSLTDSQVTAVIKIYEASDQEMQKAFDASGGDRQAARETMMALRKKTDEKIEALLTPDQKKKFAEIQKQRQSRMQGRMRNN